MSSFFIGDSKISMVEKIDFDAHITEILSEKEISFDEKPFYVCDLGDIIMKHQLWLESFPRITPFYAVKCNPDPIILSMMAKFGISFDCASMAEIEAVMSQGVGSERIIYANPCKPASHIQFAKQNGVNLMTCDTVSEVVKMARINKDAELVIRMFVETSSARCPLGLKFGASVEDVVKIMQKAQELHLKVVGISFHVGSGCFDAAVYGSAIRESRKLFDLAECFGFKLTLLDLGGGYPGDLQKESNMELFQSVKRVINQSLEEYFPVQMCEMNGINVIAEPGRFFVSSAYRLCCTVTTTKVSAIAKSSNTSSQSYCCNYYLNDGTYGSFNCVIYDHYLPDYYLLHSRDEYAETYPTVLWGPTCDSMDKICETNLPLLHTDDKIVFTDMGAYTMAAGCTFNGFPRPDVHYFLSEALSPALLPDVGLFVESKPYEEITHVEEVETWMCQDQVSSDTDATQMADAVLEEVLMLALAETDCFQMPDSQNCVSLSEMM